MAENSDSCPWVDGNYKGSGAIEAIILNGETVTIEDHPEITMKFKYGDFGEADAEVAEASGQATYNVESTNDMWGQEMVEHGVVHGDGRKLTLKTMMGIWNLEWITPEEAERLANDGDPVEAPPSDYKIEPERQGKLLWITGPPGSGNCTYAQLISKDSGYVYYNGDCFLICKNPYIPNDAAVPSMAMAKQRKLIGEGVKERKEAETRIGKEYQAKMAGEDYSNETIEDVYKLICEDIAKERARMGGDWIIASMIDSQSLRDFVRSQLGPELQFVVLDVALEDNIERLKTEENQEENGIEMAKSVFAICEPAGEDEPNTLGVKVTSDMSPEEVVEKILEMDK